MTKLDLHEPGGSPLRPEPGRNNAWASYQDSGRCIVFVHGLGDDSRDCWFDPASKSYWPDRVRSSSEFRDYSIFLGGYPTSKLLSGSYGISDCAAELFEALNTPQSGARAVLDHEAIVFVCHSLGGIVTRYMLNRNRESFQTQSIGLLLIASPSKGSVWADAVSEIARSMGNEVLQTLQTDSHHWRAGGKVRPSQGPP